MADKPNRDDSVSGRADEDVRGVAGDQEDDGFDETEDDLDDEEDEEGTTF